MKTPADLGRGLAGPALALAAPAVVAAVIVLGLLAMIGATPAAAAGQETYDPEARLAELGIELPEARPYRGPFRRWTRTGNLVVLSGHGQCQQREEGAGRGKVPTVRTLEQAQEDARHVAICLMASLKSAVGDLSRVERIVRVMGMVNAESDFTGHSQVINGASELLVEVFGEERGRHARAAVGMSSLPGNLSVEIEMMVEVRDEEAGGG